MTMGLHKQQYHIPLSSTSASAMTAASAPFQLQADFACLPMTPPEPADGLLSPAKDAGSVNTAIHVISTERAALAHLERLYQNDQLAQNHLIRAVDTIARTVRNGGKLVCCGVGKSGKIAKKLEATMNSLGVHSAFLHPTEALHGDLGMLRPNDTLLLISFSGRTPELLLLLPHIPPTVTVIALTSHTHPSTCPLLSFNSSDMGILLPAPIHEDEESSIGVSAPTSSTTVALSLGDALAIATARRLHTTPGRGPAEVFKSFHPGGSIGAASTASTPLSMSSASFDYLPVRPQIPPFAEDGVQHQVQPQLSQPTQPSQPPPIETLIYVPLTHIPTVPPPPNKTSIIRLLDILLTAIQHPQSKSWVFTSSSVLIPPRQLRYLSSRGCVDMEICSSGDGDCGLYPPYLVPRDSWLLVSDECSIDEARAYFRERGVSQGVVGVVRGQDFGDVIGVLEVEDLFEESDSTE
ncbi:hypothetical protein BDV18DRAFT_29869 [Aspergillus unguis]